MALGLWLLSCQELYLQNVLHFQNSLPKSSPCHITRTAAPHFRPEWDGVPIGRSHEKWTPGNVMAYTHTVQQVAHTCPHLCIWTCTHGYVHHTHIYTHIKKKNMASVTPHCLRLLITYILYFFRLKTNHTIPNEAFQNEQYFKFSSAFSHTPKNDQEKVCLAKLCLFRVYFSQCTSSLSMYGLSRGWHSHLISLVCFWETSSLNILECLAESDNGWNRTMEGGNRVPSGRRLSSDCGALLLLAHVYTKHTGVMRGFLNGIGTAK